MTPGLAAGSISGIGTYGQHRGPRTMHTPPQTPPYHGTLNGHGGQGTYGQIGVMGVSGGQGTYGRIGAMGGMHQHKNNGINLDSKPLPGPPQLHAGVG